MERRSRSQVAPVKLMEKFIAQQMSPPVLDYLPTMKKSIKEKKEEKIEEKQAEGYC